LPQSVTAACLSLLTLGAIAEDLREAWREVPMPAGIQVVLTELEGPVFADASGRTLYQWPQHKLRNGYSGEAPGVPACYDEVVTVTTGLMSPYPAGIPLPELDSRSSCADLWPPVLADEFAEPLGDWSLVERRDGTRQWAYDEQPLYTSVRDQEPGDTFGGSGRKVDGDSPAIRVPVGPPALLPPGFAVKTTSLGRMITTDRNYAVYALDGEGPGNILCRGACLDRWTPLLAPGLAIAQGDWTIVERAPGQRQWAFHGSPVYTHRLDTHPWSQQGSDEAGWRNVFTQHAPAPPQSFTEQATLAGTVLATAEGKTIYVYRCGEDSQDQLACDHPQDSQVYRLAICGGGDAQRCQERWPYVPAVPGTSGTSRSWRPQWIDPMTGRFTSADSPGAAFVWTYRDRPVYTYDLDRQAGDVHGAGIGEWRGKRNGLAAFWLRDDYMQGIE